MNKKKILIFSFSRIGDVVLSTAVISPLREHFPDSEISILTGKGSSDMLWGDPRISEIITYDNKGLHKGFSGRIRLIKELRARKFGLIIDLRDSFWSRLIGGAHWGANPLLKLNPEYGKMHAVDRYLDILRVNGLKVVHSAPEIPISIFEKEQAREFLLRKNVKKDDVVIGIHPGGSWQYKLWPLKKFAALGDMMVQKYNARLLVFAGPDETYLQLKMSELMKSSPIIIKGVSLRELAAIIQKCRIYIGNDTGPMHIAAAVGARVVSIFGSTDARRSDPMGMGKL